MDICDIHRKLFVVAMFNHYKFLSNFQHISLGVYITCYYCYVNYNIV